MANTIGTVYVQVEPTTDGIGGKLNSALSKDAESAGTTAGGKFASAMGTALKVSVASVGIATTAIAGFGKASVDAGMSFDSAMSQVGATMGFTVSEINTEGSKANQTMQQLRDFAQEMGSSTAFSASESAEALNYMALAGYDAETSMKMLPTVLNLAAAGGIGLAEASDMVTDAQSALGLSLEDTYIMVDEMAAASSKSNTSVAQLGEAFLTIGANAKSLSGGTTELSTALGLLADNGIKGAEGGTHLRNIMMALNPTTKKAIEAWDALGISAYDADGNLRPLQDTFADLNSAMDGMTNQEKTDILSKMFNKTDLASVNALLSTSADRWNELGDAIYYSDGAASSMADVQLDNLEGDITLFKSALEGAQIAISDQLTPTLREFVQFGSDGLSRLTTAFSEGGLSGAMAEFGTLLSEGLSQITSMLPQMVNAGMQLLGALGDGIIQNLPMITDAVLQILLMLTNTLIENLPTIVEAGAQIILQLALGLAEALPTLIPAIVDVVLTIVQYLIENIDLLVDASIQLMTGIAEGLINALPILIEKAPQIIVALVSAIITNVPKLLEASLKIITTLRDALITYLPQLLAKVPEILAQLKDKFISLATNLTPIGQKLVDTIKTAIQNTWNRVTGAVGGWISTLKEAFMEKVQNFADVGKQIIEGIKNGIKDGWDSLKSYVGEVANSLLDSAKSALKIASPSRAFANEVGKWIPAGIAMGIKNNMGVLLSAVDEMSNSALTNTSLDYMVGGSYDLAGEAYAGANVGGYNQTINVYSPTSLTPSEVARQTRNATRNMVMALQGV